MHFFGFSPLQRNLAFLGLLLLALIVAAAWLTPRPAPPSRTASSERNVTLSHEETETQRQLKAAEKQIEELRQQQRQLASRQADVNTRVVERIERYPVPPPAPAQSAPASSPAVVVVRDGSDGGLPSSPAPAPVAVPPQPIEIVVRTTETVDRSREDTRTETDTERKTETERKTDDVSTERRTVDSRSETEKKTETVTGGTAAGGAGLGSPGVGLLHTGQPFAKLDLKRTDVGFGPVKLGKAGLGVFLTKAWKDGQIDGGPQVNFRPGKKRSGLFIMGGYQVRERMPVLGVGVEF